MATRMHGVSAAVLLVTLTAGTAVFAQPTKDRVKSAAEEFDKGRRAFLDEHYETAAGHFENAFHDAPRPEPLRHAIRSRSKAGQTARAATLSQHAGSRYPEDAALSEVARQVLQEAAPKLYGVTVHCDIPCSVAVDGRLSSLDDALETKLFVEPGDHALVVTFSDDRSVSKAIAGAVAGHAEVFSIVAPPVPPKRPSARTLTAENPKPFNRVPFFIGAGVTVAVGALTVVSYFAAKSVPGEEAVLRDCRGVGESCATWKDAKSAELRTNIGIFATAGLGVATAAIGLFFTRWSGTQAPTSGHLVPTFTADGRGAAAAGLSGAF